MNKAHQFSIVRLIFFCLAACLAILFSFAVSPKYGPLVDAVKVLFYFVLLAYACYSFANRMIDKTTKILVVSLLMFLAFWILIRNIKWMFTPLGSVAERYLWYLFYFPMLSISSIMTWLLKVIYFPTHKSWKIISIISTSLAMILLAFILTNDLHHLCFYNVVNSSGDHGIIYWLTMGFIGLSILSFSLIAFIQQTRMGKFNRKRYLPLIIFLLGMILYVVLDLLHVWGRIDFANDWVCVLSLFAMGILWSLTYCGAIPTNNEQKMIIQNSKTDIYLLDNSLSEASFLLKNIPLSMNEIKKVISEGEYINEKRVHYLCVKIDNGYAIYSPDFSHITALKNELDSISSNICQNIQELQKKEAISSDLLTTQLQNDVLNRIENHVSVIFTQIQTLLETSDENNKEMRLKQIRYLLTICKRCSLFATYHQPSDPVSSQTLRMAFLELSEALRGLGINSSSQIYIEKNQSSDMSLILYEKMNDLVGQAVKKGATDLYFSVKQEGEDFVLGILYDTPNDDEDSLSLSVTVKGGILA